MLRPDENANELRRRISNQPFSIRVDPRNTEVIKVGEIVEMQTIPSDIQELILNVILQFSHQFDDGVVIHVSTGDNLRNAFIQSSYDVAQSPLKAFDDTGRLKSYTVHHILQLLALVELLKSTLNNRKVLLLLDGINPIITAQKSVDGLLKPSSIIVPFLNSLKSLASCHHIYTCWVASEYVKATGGGIRNGNNRDPLTILWKQRMPRVIKYSTT